MRRASTVRVDVVRQRVELHRRPGRRRDEVVGSDRLPSCGPGGGTDDERDGGCGQERSNLAFPSQKRHCSPFVTVYLRPFRPWPQTLGTVSR